MSVDHIFKYLAYADSPPTENEKYQDWLLFEDFFSFLKGTAKEEFVPVLIHSKGVTLYSVFVPNVKFDGLEQASLNDWDLMMASRALSFTHWGSGDKEWVDVEEPFADPRSDFLRVLKLCIIIGNFRDAGTTID
ncbi:MAG: hypothetical protein IPJ71_18425 [Bdellovibrionales bacterium]|nr:hypothetical protein [Bdellovibrionales bacterium]